jgi:hypothetical protein
MSEDKKIFISQKVLDALFEQNQAELSGSELTILSATKQVFKILPAFKFILLAGGDKDPHNLIGKIYTEEQLKKVNADIYMTSVLYKDTAYEVETGFLGIPQAKEPEKVAETEKEVEKIVASEAPSEAEDFNIADLSNLVLKIFDSF